jgi:hypothetical protein
LISFPIPNIDPYAQSCHPNSYLRSWS